MLVYFLANSGKDMRNIDMNFDSRFYINYDAKSQELKILKNDNFISDYWGKSVSSVTAIVGENGVGKTSTLKLLRDRFLRGLNHPENTILIYKNNSRYEIYYDEELFTEGVVINGKKYIAEDDLVEDGKYRKITDLGIELSFKKVSNKKGSVKRNIQQMTRIGKMNSLIFQTGHWSYSRLDRMINEDILHEKLDYADYSIGEQIDSIIRGRNKRSLFYVNPSEKDKVKQDSRFEVDYLLELNAEEIFRVLQYLKNESNFDFIKKYLKIPEELYVFYDFMDAKSRGNSLFVDKDDYLRYEDSARNSKIENAIYRYLFPKEKQEIKVKEGLLLSIIERFFKNIEEMNFKEYNSEILKIEYKEKINQDKDVLQAMKVFKEAVITILNDKKLNGILTENEKQQEILIKRIQESSENCVKLLSHVIDEFSCHTGVREIEEKVYDSAENWNYPKEVTIEYPVIKMDKKGVKVAYEFFKRYQALKGKKSLYFAWRDLSSGETQLLNLLTSLSSAIEHAENKHIIILLDEVEASLHPMWQKEIIKILVESLNEKAQEVGKTVQIIITTHSPFILSDFPLNSTILLERNKEGKVIRRKELDGQPTTLGANIHELYSHSFFLSGGLIGDYAKKKINEVADKLIHATDEQSIDWLKKEKLINQVGEPIIKARLVELYNQKYQLFKPKETQGIKTEIEELKKRIEYLEKKSDDL